MRKMKWVAGLGIVAMFILATGAARAQADAKAGAALYTRLKCARCHGDQQQGDGRIAKKFKLKMTDWTDKASMSKHSDQYLRDIITKGGKALGKSKKMASYKKKLTAAQLDDLIAFIRSRTP